MQEAFDHYPSLLHTKTAVTVVAHGLNLKPEAMLPLIGWLTNRGSDVYLVKLSGHYKGGIEINDVTGAIWHEEMRSVYTAARNASVAYSVPLFFLGYSLGALLGQSMIGLSMKNAPFDKQILIAPAIALRRRSQFIRLLFFFGEKMMLPSYAPKDYRVNNALPLMVYKLLFAEEQRFFKSGFKTMGTPTLIIIDEKDELISFRRLVSRIQKFGLDNCQVMKVGNDEKKRKGQYHHLIIDEQTMGKRNWVAVTGEMEQFLFEQAV